MQVEHPSMIIIESLPVRGAWIEISSYSDVMLNQKSLPVRGAWIEITYAVGITYKYAVAPRAGSVD